MTEPRTGPRTVRAAAASASTSAGGPVRKKAARKKVKRRKPNPYLAWAKRLERTRPGLIRFTADGLRSLYGAQPYARRWDPTSELVMTILTQNSADINAEHAYQELRKAYPSDRPVEHHDPGPGWGGVGLPDGVPPDWSMVDAAPLEELVEVIRPGGLPNQKAKGIKAALRSIHEARGDYSLEFLGDMSALEARTWLTGIKGVGVKTASVVLLFSFGHPLMPVDRHVERVARRGGLLPPNANAEEAHDYFLAMLQPDEMHEAHVNLIRHGRLACHARNPAHGRCPLQARCRFYDPKAP